MNYLFLFLSSPRDFLIDFRQRGREREKHWSVASGTPPGQGSNLQSRLVPSPGIKPLTFQFTGQHSNQMGHTGQGMNYFMWHWFVTPCKRDYCQYGLGPLEDKYVLCWVLVLAFFAGCLTSSSDAGLHDHPSLSFLSSLLFLYFSRLLTTVVSHPDLGIGVPD